MSALGELGNDAIRPTWAHSGIGRLRPKAEWRLLSAEELKAAASISRGWYCALPPVAVFAWNAPSGTRSTAATTKCAKSSSGSQSRMSGGSRKDWSRLNGTNVPIAALCTTHRAT